MVTYEMVGVADQNTKTYESKWGTYSKKTGFVLDNLPLNMTVDEVLNVITHEDMWKIQKPKEPPRKEMTIREIEDALGYKIKLNFSEPFVDFIINNFELED